MSKRFSYWGSRASFASTKSVFFDGIDADLRFADSVFDSLSGGSMGMWIRPSSLSSTGTLFACTINAVNYFVSLSVNASGGLQIFARINTNQYFAATANSIISIDNYYYVVWTHSGGNHNVYVDGVDRALTFTIDVNRDRYFDDVVGTRRYTIGNFRRDTSANYYHGYIDEFVISPTAWSQAQVTALYNSGCPANLALHSDYANMITWSRMGDGTGDAYPTIVDQIGANDATMTNMVAGDITTTVPC